MSTTATPPQAAARPIVGTFDDAGLGERAVHDLHAAGFGRDEVSMEWEEVEIPNSAPPAPRSFAAPFAFVTSLLSGAILAILAAHFAPKSLTLNGFGWQVSPAVILALVGGTFGWIMGAILGFGHIEYEEEPPAPISLRAPIVSVAVQAPSRPSEARAILLRAGAHDVQGGDRAYVEPGDVTPTARAARPRATASPTRQQTGRQQTTQGQRVTPAAPAGRHERLPLGPHDTHSHPQRTGIALVIAVAAGALFALLRRRRD